MLTWRFCNKEEAIEHLSRKDDYLNKINDFNIKSFLKTDDLDSYLNSVLPKACQDWSEKQVELFEDALFSVVDKLMQAEIYLDQEIKLILTDGSEMHNLEYTRGNAIVFPYAKHHSLSDFFQGKSKTDLFGPSESLIVHELFHILSRHNVEMRKQVYQSFGFKEVNTEFLPTPFEDQIVNPDAIEHKWLCKVHLKLTDAQKEENKKRKKQKLDPLPPESIWGFPLIRESNWKSFMVVDEHSLEPITTISVFDTDLPRRINSKITGYLSHAEEIAAEYFKHLVCYPDNLRHPELKLYQSSILPFFSFKKNKSIQKL